MKSVLVVEDEEIIEQRALQQDEEIAVQKKKKELSPKQLRVINQKSELKKYCEGLGGFVHMLCISNKLLFSNLDLDKANISRLIYLATYIDYNNREENLLIKHGKNYKIEPITKGQMQKILKLSDSTFKRFLKDMKKNNLIWEVDRKFYISNEYFTRGKTTFNDKEYTRIFVNTVRNLYENCPATQHKTLSYVYQLIPYINFETNILCANPQEVDFSKLIKLSLYQICELLGVSTDKDNMRKLKKNLRKFYLKIDSEKYYLFSYAIINDTVDYYVINPLVVWAGKDSENIRGIVKLCFFQ